MTESEQKVAEKLGFYLMAPKNIPSFWIRNGGNCDITLNDGQRRSLWDALVAAQSQHAERWIAVEVKPTKADWYNVCRVTDGHRSVRYWDDSIEAWMYVGDEHKLFVPNNAFTHYQPLPAAPERST